jgi:hypothetical protein
MAEYYWSGNRNAGQRGTSSENYAAGMPNSSYDWGVTSNWLVKDYSSPNNDFGYALVETQSFPQNSTDEAFFMDLADEPVPGYIEDPLDGQGPLLPMNACLFGGISGSSGDFNGGTWGDSSSSTGEIYRIHVDYSYGKTDIASFVHPDSFILGNTLGSTFGSYSPGTSAGITIQGLATLSGNSLGSLQIINTDGSTALFGVSAGLTFGGSNSTTIGTSGGGSAFGASMATQSLYNSFASAITAGVLKMQLSNYTGSADTEFTLTQNVGGGYGNTEITGTLITGVTSGVTGSTFDPGLTCGGGNTANFSGGLGTTKEIGLRVRAQYIDHHSPRPVNLIDSRSDRVFVTDAGQFNYKRGRIDQFISRRTAYDYEATINGQLNTSFESTSTYLIDTQIGTVAGEGTVVIAGGTYQEFDSGVERSADRPVTYIGTSGGASALTVRAFRKGLVQIIGDVTTISSYPEEPYAGNGRGGRTEISRKLDDDTISTITTVNMKAFNDEDMIGGSKTNNEVYLNCGMTLSTLAIDSGTVRVGPDIRDRTITVVDGTISGLGKLLARNPDNVSYSGFKLGGNDFPTNGATGGVTLPEGMLVSDPQAEIEFTTGHYVMADFLGSTSANEAFQKPIPPIPPGAKY